MKSSASSRGFIGVLLSDEGRWVFGKWACGVIERGVERLIMNALIEEECILTEGGNIK
ncbi:MAG TPA: hypothetical protein PKW97_07220 [Syntrophorhabdus sp.]|nr:hypothetical protein [Syntrophorhabdus sp.]HOD78726.1 hypothetical protein [Syntrophorhabdus sp.]HQM26293.1 hypothetical protein [Syntrophorhabdus sp.]